MCLIVFLPACFSTRLLVRVMVISLHKMLVHMHFSLRAYLPVVCPFSSLRTCLFTFPSPD
jgi:hypothetical protein